MSRFSELRLGTAVRWSWSLGAGALLGTGVGFAFGLIRPRVKD